MISELYGTPDILLFSVHLAQTIAWCQPRLQMTDLRHSLRSAELQPCLLIDISRSQMVSQLVRHRGMFFHDKVLEPINSSTQSARGKLLAYFPNEDLTCGAAEVATQGFLDVNNAPAWDTWIGFYEDERGFYLVSWVPPELVELVGEGIWVNPEQCIAWLSNIDTALSQELKSSGLLK
jgi:hypothetical protein